MGSLQPKLILMRHFDQVCMNMFFRSIVFIVVILIAVALVAVLLVLVSWIHWIVVMVLYFWYPIMV